MNCSSTGSGSLPACAAATGSAALSLAPPCTASATGTAGTAASGSASGSLRGASVGAASHEHSSHATASMAHDISHESATQTACAAGPQRFPNDDAQRPRLSLPLAVPPLAVDTPSHSLGRSGPPGRATVSSGISISSATRSVSNAGATGSAFGSMRDMRKPDAHAAPARVTGSERYDSESPAADASGRAALLLELSISSGLPFPSNSFDTVVDTFGLCSYEDPAAALAEMRRVLRPGGTLLLLEHGASWYGWLTQLLDSSALAHARRHGCSWNRRIDELVAASNMRIRTQERRHFGTTSLYYLEKA